MWLPDPPDGTKVCGGFDGSEVSDFTAIKLETIGGRIITPRYGPDRRPTIWNPAEWNGRIPRGEVRAAWGELVKRFDIARVYCDPGFHDETSWETEIEQWAQEWPLANGKPERFLEFPTTSMTRMFPALRRFEADLSSGVITHDGCPVTAAHMKNARKIARGERYTLGKPSQHQKIDAGVTSVICHEAACDARAAGWGAETESYAYVF